MRLFLASFGTVLLSASALSGTARADEATPPAPDRKVFLTVEPTPEDHAIAAAEAVAHGGNPDISNILYVNRCATGCTLTKGTVNNAIQNTSSIPDGDDGLEFTIPAFAHGDERWNELMQCLRDIYLPYNVEVTDVDPGNTPHHEAIASGLPGDLGLDNGIGGIAPSYCEPRNNMISFSFLNSYNPNNVLEMCATVGQEASHSFGIRDHLFDCTDPMTYLVGCGQKFFRNKQMFCGEFEQRACECAGTRQNSHVKLLSVFGPGTQPIPAPTISIQTPTEGGTITNNSVFAAAADDPRTVYRVELYLNDWLWGEYVESDSITPPWSPPSSYTVQADGDLPDGNYEVRMVAYNDLGISSEATVNVTKGSPCTTADTCLEGQQCAEGKCFWAEPSGEVGDACTYDEFCIGENTYDGTCVTAGDQSICTLPCFTGPNDTCPEGFDCLATSADGTSGVCWFAAPEEDPGCCSTGETTTGTLALQLTMVGLVGGLIVRRRRR